MFVPVIINSFTEFGIFGETNYGIMFYLFIVLMLHSQVAQETSIVGGKKRNENTHVLFRPIITS